jgi:hypothetical protein
MRQTLKRIFIGLLFVTFFVGAGFATRARPLNRFGQPTGRQILRGPGEWVPFTAIETKVRNDGTVRIGKIYRSSDGSTRTEVGPSLDAVEVTAIKNIANKTLYLCCDPKTLVWESHPMELPPTGWQPLAKIVGPDALQPDRIEGFSVVKTVSTHATTYEALELNFWPIRTIIPCKAPQASACGNWLSDITIGEPPEDYFLPPAGVQIVAKAQPGGITKARR